MLVFIDESGDTGLKLAAGSSKYFGISLVAFWDSDEATACDQRIELLKRELGWRAGQEFHFKRNSARVRKAFLEAVGPYGFFYYGIVINKDKLYGEGFKNKSSFYKYVCGLVFENAKGRISEAIVVIDESSGDDFQQQLARYLRQKVKGNTGESVIRKVKMQRSQSNNLLQLADYTASITCRSVQSGQSRSDEFRRLIAHREIFVQTWPSL
ncbi:TPA: hypothetical protein DEP96_03090 [Candidatus Uhrbacteria bacterium]|nr:hypothetical protein [Candidatus Uhrbacteria bacterium]